MSCANWETIPSGSYCSLIGLLANEDLNTQAGNFRFSLSSLSTLAHFWFTGHNRVLIKILIGGKPLQPLISDLDEQVL